MRCCLFLAALVAAVVIAECGHTFMGTSVLTQVVYHQSLWYLPRLSQKRVEELRFTMPLQHGYGKTIQGILAYDNKHSRTTANVTDGGLGLYHVTLRFQSEPGEPINYDVYIYA